MTATLAVDLRGCARCRADGHPGLLFQRLTHPVELEKEPSFTYWAACPTNGEPILLRTRPKTSQ